MDYNVLVTQDAEENLNNYIWYLIYFLICAARTFCRRILLQPEK